MVISKEMNKVELKIQEPNHIILIIMFMGTGLVGILMVMMNKEKNKRNKEKEEASNRCNNFR
jgi:hypothetical protein